MSLAVQPDYLVAQLVCEYLSTAASILAGVPSLVDLPREIMDHGGQVQFPSLVIVATEDRSSSGAHKIVRFNPVLKTMLQPSSAEAAQGLKFTTREESSIILRSVNQRLADQTAFWAWLEALPDARRTDWQPLDIMRPSGDLVPLRSKATGALDYGLSWSWPLLVV